MRKTTTFAVAAGAALALALTGCGSKTENGTASPAGQAQDQSGSGSGLAAPFGDVLKLADAAKQGTEKSKSAKMSMNMSLGGQAVTANGAMTFDGPNPKFTMTMDSPQGATDMRYLDNTIYLKVPPEQAAQYGTDKAWLKISPDAGDPLSQTLSKSMQQASKQSDPTQILDQVAKAGRIVGSDQTELNGQQVNHYRVELDVNKAVDQFTGDLPAEVKDQMTKMLAGKDIKIPAELWLDKDQLPLQVTMDETRMMQAMGAGAQGAGKITVKYSDWGAPVDVTAPPADQVGDFSEIAKQLGGGH
ncbi:LppX_LprAFG lipoprotein [Amycolatopsis jiangsuensis]|uniref:LppX_LprAFG lipoprotein n=1 Tax=Amycolatopsis jiangsuensis TaxID=1181879 RepID=A0A840J4B5_9PSEU|nr:LppX_LprAFG lipoprotein [Amycolatopsis jiangsuensis]MBB4688569.1 hypothetical protein [Amycolatopsis jiangsuensis]